MAHAAALYIALVSKISFWASSQETASGGCEHETPKPQILLFFIKQNMSVHIGIKCTAAVINYSRQSVGKVTIYV